MTAAGPLLTLAALAVALLAGCGQKGPLTLPKAKAAQASSPTASAAASAPAQ
jgi:predicted small lipoprotein YifL